MFQYITEAKKRKGMHALRRIRERDWLQAGVLLLVSALLTGCLLGFEHHEAFPKRVNTEFIQVLNRSEINMRVWERGAGETLACGTGTCAAVVACVLNGKTDENVTVHLLGGDLYIVYDREAETVFMTGPATVVFDGEIDITDIDV